MQTIEIVSVKDGKFHRPDSVTFNGSSNELRDARMMRCGRSLVPYNFFETLADANRHTGGRLERYICQQCERKVSHLWRVPKSEQAYAEGCERLNPKARELASLVLNRIQSEVPVSDGAVTYARQQTLETIIGILQGAV